MKRKIVLLLSFMFLLNFVNLALAEESSYLAEMKKLAELKKQSKITDQEFDLKKAEIKNRFFGQQSENLSQPKVTGTELIDNRNSVCLGDTKQVVKSKLGSPIYDGNHYWKYGMVKTIHFTAEGKVKDIVGFEFSPPETAPIDEAIRYGVKLFKDCSYAEAQHFFEQIEKREPKHSTIKYNLGMIHGKLGNKSLSYKYLEQAFELNPNEFDGNENVSKAFKAKIKKKLDERVVKPGLAIEAPAATAPETWEFYDLMQEFGISKRAAITIANDINSQGLRGKAAKDYASVIISLYLKENGRFP